jgi:nifR3 family TIM-barrel protein
MVGDVQLENRLFLAPMAGQTAYAFRRLSREFGDCGLVCTELISSEAMREADGMRRARLKFDWVPDEEYPLAVQLFGADPAQMAEAAKIVADNGADIVDINMGCWVPKVAATGGGAVLLKDVCTAAAVVEAVVKAVDVPVTVKIRAGWEHENPTAVPFARAAQDVGAQLITVHWRFATEGFQPITPRWETIGAVKAAVDIPVIGNGDVHTAEDAARLMDLTGADGVMIGRAALGSPWIFRDIAHEIRTGEPHPGLTYEERLATAVRHAQITMETTPRTPNDQLPMLSAQLMRYTKGMPYAARVRHALSGAKTLEEIEDGLGLPLPYLSRTRRTA